MAIRLTPALDLETAAVTSLTGRRSLARTEFAMGWHGTGDEATPPPGRPGAGRLRSRGRPHAGLLHPGSIPTPTEVTVLPGNPGPVVRWTAPDSDFEIIEGWQVYRKRPGLAARRITPAPLLVREFGDPDPAVSGLTEYWVTALSRGGVESEPSRHVPSWWTTFRRPRRSISRPAARRAG